MRQLAPPHGSRVHQFLLASFFASQGRSVQAASALPCHPKGPNQSPCLPRRKTWHRFLSTDPSCPVVDDSSTPASSSAKRRLLRIIGTPTRCQSRRGNKPRKTFSLPRNAPTVFTPLSESLHSSLPKPMLSVRDPQLPCDASPRDGGIPSPGTRGISPRPRCRGARRTPGKR